MYTCISVPGGWQTQSKSNGRLLGPVFNRIQELWQWQRNNLYKGA
jgi:hypothetical protein